MGWFSRILVAFGLVFMGMQAPTAALAAGPRASVGLLGLGGMSFVQGAAFSPGTPQSSVTVPLTASSLAGDLLVAWVSQFNAPGQVHVSDSGNGAWARAAGETFSSGSGDIALYFVKPVLALGAVTVTISADAPTFIAGSVAHYQGLGLLGSLDSVVVAEHPASPPSRTVDSGPTAQVGGGEFVFGGLITGGLPGAVALGSSQGQRFQLRATDDSNSALAADVLSSGSGTQSTRMTLQNPTDWYVVCAVFHPSTV
jgi:hypothetical protein